MDLLTPILRDAGLRRRLLGVRPLAERQALRFPCERSLGFHLVLCGPIWLHRDGQALRLDSGDLAVMARGEHHSLAACDDLQGLQVTTLGLDEADAGALPGDGLQVLSGAYQLWHAPLHPALQSLPPWSVLRAAELPPGSAAAQALALLRDELGGDRPGATVARHALLDLLFTYLLRELLATPAAGPGFATAQADPALQRALALLQADCSRPWTLQQLAREAGLSRSVLATRFRSRLGDTPQNYLRTLRIQRAMRLLSETDDKLEAVAQAVGYADAFALSKAFKRLVGSSPLAFRRADREQAGSAWRFGPADAAVPPSLGTAAPLRG